MKALEEALVGVIRGNLERLPVVLNASNTELLNAATTLGRLSVSRSNLINVISKWREGHFPAEDVQKWASFVRRGYVPRSAGEAVRPISIEYDSDDEDLIVETIGRLDEIGDQVDGNIDELEQVSLLAALQ